MLLIITPDFRQGLQIFRRYATLWTNTIYRFTKNEYDLRRRNKKVFHPDET